MFKITGFRQETVQQFPCRQKHFGTVWIIQWQEHYRYIPMNDRFDECLLVSKYQDYKLQEERQVTVSHKSKPQQFLYRVWIGRRQYDTQKKKK